MDQQKKPEKRFYEMTREPKKKRLRRDFLPLIGAVAAILLLLIMTVLVLIVLPYTRINLVNLMRRH